MTVECRICREPQVVSCTDAQYVDWKENRRLIQNVMPGVPKEERELLISGICGKCFDQMFRKENGDGDEEDD